MRVFKVVAAVAIVYVLLVIPSPTARAAEPLVLYDAANAQGPMHITNDVVASQESHDGQKTVQFKSDEDPYSRLECRMRLQSPVTWPAGGAVLEIRFFDKGAGVIMPRLRTAKGWTTPSQQGSYTRLNTMQWRSAWFAFTAPPAQDGKDDQLAIAGLQYLGQIRLWPALSKEKWAAIRDSVPIHVEPMVSLKHPVKLTTTAGIAVHGDMSTLNASLENLRELAPLAKVLGFTSIETYVTWNRIEPKKKGEFDFRYYDAIVKALQPYNLKLFPLLIVGSAYALPQWFAKSDENVGFVCLAHGLSNPIQSIWSPYHKAQVRRVLKAFGDHYDGKGVLEAVRLGPSGNYGESQYPAGGNWGYRKNPMHIHIGWWCGDKYARKDFQRYAKEKYKTIDALNKAWDRTYKSFDDVEPVLPETLYSKQERLDTTTWYTDCMSHWCAWWAQVATKDMPHTPIYQSAGGWGFCQAGTDYSAQTKAMAKLDGGVRLTNETDSYEQNFYATRLAATSARLYGAHLGYEPASSHTARGVVGRIFNTTATNGDHLFTYHSNLFYDQMAIDKWLKYLPTLDERQDPVIDVAVYYPETYNHLSDSAFRYLYGWGFNPRAREVRRVVECDYLDDRLIRDGFLDRYKALVFVWGNIVPQDVLDAVDAWVRKGGVVIYPSFPKGNLANVQGDSKTFVAWSKGDTGRGSFHRFKGDMEPPSLYGDYVHKVLLGMTNLNPWTQKAIRIIHRDKVFFSIQQDGHCLILNYNPQPTEIVLKPSTQATIPGYGIGRIDLK